MPRVTTYTLRKGSPAKTRTDVVVIGAVRSPGGDVAVAPGGEDVAAAYGRRFKPLLSSMAFRGDVGETLRVPSPDGVRAGQLLLVGLGAADAVDAHVVRRAAGTAARSLGNAASVALALPADDASLVAAAAEGFTSGLYSFTTYKSGGEPSSVSEVLLLSPLARDEDVLAALERARTVAEHVDHARDWVNTPPNDLYPSRSRSGSSTSSAPARARGPRSRSRCSGPTSSPSWAAAASSASARDRTGHRGWCGSPGRRPARPTTWPWSARASPTTPAASPSSPAPAWRR